MTIIVHHIHNISTILAFSTAILPSRHGLGGGARFSKLCRARLNFNNNLSTGLRARCDAALENLRKLAVNSRAMS